MSASCECKSVLEAVASSLTEMFSPDIHRAHRRHARGYDFVSQEMLAYFRRA